MSRKTASGLAVPQVFGSHVLFDQPSCVGAIIEVSHHASHVTVFDRDGDGRSDLMIGGEAGTIYLFRRDWVNGTRTTASPGKLRQCQLMVALKQGRVPDIVESANSVQSGASSQSRLNRATLIFSVSLFLPVV